MDSLLLLKLAGPIETSVIAAAMFAVCLSAVFAVWLAYRRLPPLIVLAPILSVTGIAQGLALANTFGLSDALNNAPLDERETLLRASLSNAATDTTAAAALLTAGSLIVLIVLAILVPASKSETVRSPRHALPPLLAGLLVAAFTYSAGHTELALVSAVAGALVVVVAIRRGDHRETPRTDVQRAVAALAAALAILGAALVNLVDESLSVFQELSTVDPEDALGVLMYGLDSMSLTPALIGAGAVLIGGSISWAWVGPSRRGMAGFAIGVLGVGIVTATSVHSAGELRTAAFLLVRPSFDDDGLHPTERGLKIRVPRVQEGAPAEDSRILAIGANAIEVDNVPLVVLSRHPDGTTIGDYHRRGNRLPAVIEALQHPAEDTDSSLTLWADASTPWTLLGPALLSASVAGYDTVAAAVVVEGSHMSTIPLVLSTEPANATLSTSGIEVGEGAIDVLAIQDDVPLSRIISALQANPNAALQVVSDPRR